MFTRKKIGCVSLIIIIIKIIIKKIIIVRTRFIKEFFSQIFKFKKKNFFGQKSVFKKKKGISTKNRNFVNLK